jgi:hypothetical protein
MPLLAGFALSGRAACGKLLLKWLETEQLTATISLSTLRNSGKPALKDVRPMVNGPHCGLARDIGNDLLYSRRLGGVHRRIFSRSEP